MAKLTPEERLLRQQLTKELKSTYHKVNRRATRIEQQFGSTPATQGFRKSGLSFKTKGKSIQDLKNELRDLKYYDSLKTLSVKGAKSYQKTFKQLDESLTSPDVRKEFFDVYERSVEENQLVENYKYEVFEFISERLNDHTPKEEIIKGLRDEYQRLYRRDNIPSVDDSDKNVVYKRNKKLNKRKKL